MRLNNGETLAGFRIVRLLGSGGMGEAYPAEHPRLPRRDALKILPADVSADADYRARFNREADLASTLWHPYIVGVHDRGEYEGHLWISMDYVDGLDAARLLTSRFPAGMPTDQVVRIVTAWRVRSTMRTSRACCTATSNRRTSCSPMSMTTIWRPSSTVLTPCGRSKSVHSGQATSHDPDAYGDHRMVRGQLSTRV